MLGESISILPRQQAIDLDGPAGPPPEGEVPSLDNPPNGNDIAIPVITICVILTAVFYSIRFYAKWLGKRLNVADYLSGVAFPLFWVYVYYSYALSWTPGYLVHMWDLRLGDVADFSYICWIATLFYIVIIALIKCAILLEWVDIFVSDRKRGYFAWACYITCGIVVTLSVILFVMSMVNCTPFEANWDPLIPGGYCRFDVTDFGLASSTTNLVLDMIPLILVQKVIWGLKLSWQKKMGVSVVFLIGVAGIVAGIVRVYFATQFYTSTDTSYFFSIMALCTLCETTCAHLILCVPFTPKAMASLQQTKAYTGIKKYMSLRTNTTYGKGSDSFQELRETPREGSARSHWFAGSKGTANTSTSSSDDERLHRPSAV